MTLHVNEGFGPIELREWRNLPAWYRPYEDDIMEEILGDRDDPARVEEAFLIHEFKATFDGRLEHPVERATVRATVVPQP